MIDAYINRRAKPGQAALKAELVILLQDNERMITRAVIMHSSANTPNPVLELYKLERQRLVGLLIGITKD